MTDNLAPFSVYARNECCDHPVYMRILAVSPDTVRFEISQPECKVEYDMPTADFADHVEREEYRYVGNLVPKEGGTCPRR